MTDLNSLDDIRDHHFAGKRKAFLVTVVVILVAFLTLTVTLMVGNYEISWADVIRVFLGGGTVDDRQIILDVRLPRLLCCCLVGAGLSLSGLAMQSLFKNPMASPSILGVSSGAAFGASLAIAFGIGTTLLGQYSISLMAFVFCFISMGMVYLIARTKNGVATVTLLLAGVAIGAFFNGLVSLMQFVSDEDALSAIVYWTMGSFNNCLWDEVLLAALPVLAGIVLIVSKARELNLISAGEEQAANMGVNIKSTRIILIIATSLCVGGSVAISGTIGFVGLIIPHIFRMMVGPNHKLLIPLCIFGGAAFMMAIDTISKAAFSVSIPVGILTSLIGAPFFIYVMRTRKREMWE